MKTKTLLLALLVTLAMLAPQTSHAQSMREQTRNDYIVGFAPVLITWGVVSVVSLAVFAVKDYQQRQVATPINTLTVSPWGVSLRF